MVVKHLTARATSRPSDLDMPRYRGMSAGPFGHASIGFVFGVGHQRRPEVDQSRESAVVVRAVRGATRLTADDADQMADAVCELVTTILERNDFALDDLISMVFTATPDLTSGFPAAAARRLGLGDVPLLCAQEIDVVGALSRVVRVLVHVHTDKPRADIGHIYLRGAEVLRQDLAQ